jgi:hypothetical protein
MLCHSDAGVFLLNARQRLLQGFLCIVASATSAWDAVAHTSVLDDSASMLHENTGGGTVMPNKCACTDQHAAESQCRQP